MSDFDAVLERLLTDPAFAASLATDPGRALAGYALAADEVEILRSQVAVDVAGEASRVETRTTKSSTFGMFSSLGEWAGFGSATGAGAGAGQAAGQFGAWVDATDAAGLGSRLDASSAAGATAANAVGQVGAALGEPSAVSGLGNAPDSWGAGGGAVAARTGLGDAPDRDLDGLPAVTSRLGDAPRSGLGEAGQAGVMQGGVAEAEYLAPPKGYANKVDADGDGTWDKATYRGREDGGVDILVDLDGDGRPDFIGHDKDRDWVVDSADFDKDGDGIFEKRMYDDNGDGWLDRTVWRND